MILRDFRHVLETGALNDHQLIGFIVALMFEKTGMLKSPAQAKKAFEILSATAGTKDEAAYILERSLSVYAAIICPL